MNPRRLRVLLRLLVGLVLLAFLARRTDLSRLGATATPGLAWGVPAAVVLLILAQVFSAIRWRSILGAGAPSWLYLFRLYLIGQFLGLFLPTSVGGDAFRVMALSRVCGSSGRAVSSVLLDRLFGVFALLAYLLLGIVLAPGLWTETQSRIGVKLPPAAAVLAAVAVVGLVILVLVRTNLVPGARRMLGEAGRVLTTAVRQPGRAVRWFLLSLLVQGTYLVIWAVLGRGLGLALSPGFLLFSVPLVSLAAMLPITFSGLGVREGVWVMLLGFRGAAPATAITYSLLYFGAFVLVGLLGGLWFMLQGWEPAAVPEAGSRLGRTS